MKTKMYFTYACVHTHTHIYTHELTSTSEHIAGLSLNGKVRPFAASRRPNLQKCKTAKRVHFWQTISKKGQMATLAHCTLE